MLRPFHTVPHHTSQSKRSKVTAEKKREKKSPKPTKRTIERAKELCDNDDATVE